MAGKRRGPPGGARDPRAEPSRAVPAASPRRSSSGGRAAAAQPPRGHAGAPEPPPPLLARASPPGPGLLGARRGREKGRANGWARLGSGDTWIVGRSRAGRSRQPREGGPGHGLGAAARAGRALGSGAEGEKGGGEGGGEGWKIPASASGFNEGSCCREPPDSWLRSFAVRWGWLSVIQAAGTQGLLRVAACAQ